MWPEGSGLQPHRLYLPLILRHSCSAWSPVLSLGCASVPGSPILLHGAPLSAMAAGGDLHPSIRTLSSAPGLGAIRSARPWLWPQISWIYRAPHAAPRPVPPPLPRSGLLLHLLLPSGRRRQNMTARRGQSGHSLRRSRGGNSVQFSWFQGGFVRLCFITACGEISFIKIVRLRGAIPLKTS